VGFVIVDFAPKEERLRLDLEAFDALVAGPDAEDAAYLRDSGLLDGYALHPVVLPAVLAARSSVRVVEATVVGMRGSTVHRMWISPEASASLLHVSGGLYQVFVVRPDQVPALVARAVRLGPRPRLAPGAVVFPAAAVAGLVAPDDDERPRRVAAFAAACPVEWIGLADQVLAGRWRLWSVRSTGHGPDATIGSSVLTVLDTPAGIVRVDKPVASAGTDRTAEGTAVVTDALITATTPTRMWFELTFLLPEGQEQPQSP
jgi:hypothetical protein